MKHTFFKKVMVFSFKHFSHFRSILNSTLVFFCYYLLRSRQKRTNTKLPFHNKLSFFFSSLSPCILHQWHEQHSSVSMVLPSSPPWCSLFSSFCAAAVAPSSQLKTINNNNNSSQRTPVPSPPTTTTLTAVSVPSSKLVAKTSSASASGRTKGAKSAAHLCDKPRRASRKKWIKSKTTSARVGWMPGRRVSPMLRRTASAPAPALPVRASSPRKMPLPNAGVSWCVCVRLMSKSCLKVVLVLIFTRRLLGWDVSIDRIECRLEIRQEEISWIKWRTICSCKKRKKDGDKNLNNKQQKTKQKFNISLFCFLPSCFRFFASFLSFFLLITAKRVWVFIKKEDFPLLLVLYFDHQFKWRNWWTAWGKKKDFLMMYIYIMMKSQKIKNHTSIMSVFRLFLLINFSQSCFFLKFSFSQKNLIFLCCNLTIIFFLSSRRQKTNKQTLVRYVNDDVLLPFPLFLSLLWSICLS